MKKLNGFGDIMHKDTYVIRFADGIPAAVVKQYWNRSPWDAFRLMLRRG